MKGIIVSVLLLFSVAAKAAEGTTFCPQPKSFKYNSSSGQMEAPGGWKVYISANKARMVKFKYAEAKNNGDISGCYYDMELADTPMEINATANYYYVADNIAGLKWHRESAIEKICESTTPIDCPFHYVN